MTTWTSSSSSWLSSPVIGLRCAGCRPWPTGGIRGKGHGQARDGRNQFRGASRLRQACKVDRLDRAKVANGASPARPDGSGTYRTGRTRRRQSGGDDNNARTRPSPRDSLFPKRFFAAQASAQARASQLRYGTQCRIVTSMALAARSEIFESPGKRATSPGEVLVIVCSAVVMASLDLFVVNLALPSIARDFGSQNLSSLSWILNAYTIVYAALLVYFGRLADRYRRDRAFLLGTAVFTVASAACAASTSVGMLVAFRVIQAAGAALLTPTSLGLVLASYEPERRQGAVRAWTAVAGFAGALGPVVGGLLVAASWRWVFLINVPIGVAALVVGWRRLPPVPGHATERADPLGVVLVTAGVGLLTLGLVQGSDWGWSSAGIVVALVGSVVLLGGFVLHTMRSSNPLVHPDLFLVGPFSGSSVVALFFSMSFGAMLFSVVLWEQGVWHWSALKSGLALAPGPMMVPIFSFLVAPVLLRRYGARAVIPMGCLCVVTGLLWWTFAVTASPNWLVGMLPGWLVIGAGVGLALPTIMATAAGSLPPHSFATGSAVVNMVRQTGLAIGVAVLVAILGTVSANHSELSTFRHAWVVTAAIALVAVPPALLFLREPRARPRPRARGREASPLNLNVAGITTARSGRPRNRKSADRAKERP